MSNMRRLLGKHGICILSENVCCAGCTVCRRCFTVTDNINRQVPWCLSVIETTRCYLYIDSEIM